MSGLMIRISKPGYISDKDCDKIYDKHPLISDDRVC